MAIALAATASVTVPSRFPANPSQPWRAPGNRFLFFRRGSSISSPARPSAICFVLKEVGTEADKDKGYRSSEELPISPEGRAAERTARKQAERRTYLIAAMMSSLGITFMAVAAVYYRFSWQMEGGEVPLTEMFGTFALSVGAAVGMEFWARWAHRALWHASLWHMHESHHRPRDGPLELNDVFAIINAVPAICLLAYGFLNRGLLPGLCFGAFAYHIRTTRGRADVSQSHRAWESRSSVWPTCSCTMAWSTAGSRWAPSPTCPTSAALPLPIRCITWTSSTGFPMDSSWGPRSWNKLVAWRSWRRRSAEEPSSTAILIKAAKNINFPLLIL